MDRTYNEPSAKIEITLLCKQPGCLALQGREFSLDGKQFKILCKCVDIPGKPNESNDRFIACTQSNDKGSASHAAQSQKL